MLCGNHLNHAGPEDVTKQHVCQIHRSEKLRLRASLEDRGISKSVEFVVGSDSIVTLTLIPAITHSGIVSYAQEVKTVDVFCMFLLYNEHLTPAE